jgi:redox-sensitive bicupin YhaK (pirin superfamily)
MTMTSTAVATPQTATTTRDRSIYDRDEGGTLNPGEVQWMTAGSGFIHNENMKTKEESGCSSSG